MTKHASSLANINQRSQHNMPSMTSSTLTKVTNSKPFPARTNIQVRTSNQKLICMNCLLPCVLGSGFWVLGGGGSLVLCDANIYMDEEITPWYRMFLEFIQPEFYAFMAPYLLSCLQKPTVGPNAQLWSLKIHFNIIIPLSPCLSNSLLPWCFQIKIYNFCIYPILPVQPMWQVQVTKLLTECLKKPMSHFVTELFYD
jgi:hypothetical protein